MMGMRMATNLMPLICNSADNFREFNSHLSKAKKSRLKLSLIEQVKNLT